MSRIVRQTFLLWGTEVAAKLTQFVLIIAIARFLGDIGLGKYAFVFSFIGLFTVISDFGTSMYMVREVAKDHAKTQKYFGNILTFKLLLGVLIIISATLLIMATQHDSEVQLAVVVSSLYLFFATVNGTALNVFQAHEKLEIISVLQFVERMIIFVAGMAVLYMGLGLVPLVATFLLGEAVIFVLYHAFVARMVKLRLACDLKFIKKAVLWGLPFWLTAVFNLIYFRIDTVMLTYMAGFQATGWYNASFRALDALYFIPGSMVMVLYPVMSRLHRENKRELRRMYTRAAYFLFLIGLPISLGTTLVAGKIIHLLYAGGFAESVLVLQIIIWAAVIIFITAITGHLLNAVGKAHYFTIATAVGVVVNITLNFLLIPGFRHVGASVATVITELMVLLVLLYLAAKQGFGINVVSLFYKPAIAAVAMGSVILLLQSLPLLVIVAAAGITYGGVLLLVRGITKQDVLFLRSLFSGVA